MARRMRKFFSILLVACLLLSMMPTAVFAATPSKLYLKPNSEWLVDNARFAAYFFVGDSTTWVSMSSYGGGYYVCDVPSGGYTSVIFCRMNGGSSSNNWDNKWNQTGDLTIPTNGKNLWTLNSGDWGGGGAWSTFSCPHSWSSGKCSYCGTSCSHSWGSGTVTKAATCTATGTRTYTCSTCKHTKTETIAATGHSYTSKVTAATCTAQGLLPIPAPIVPIAIRGTIPPLPDTATPPR